MILFSHKTFVLTHISEAQELKMNLEIQSPWWDKQKFTSMRNQNQAP